MTRCVYPPPPKDVVVSYRGRPCRRLCCLQNRRATKKARSVMLTTLCSRKLIEDIQERAYLPNHAVFLYSVVLQRSRGRLPDCVHSLGVGRSDYNTADVSPRSLRNFFWDGFGGHDFQPNTGDVARGWATSPGNSLPYPTVGGGVDNLLDIFNVGGH